MTPTALTPAAKTKPKAKPRTGQGAPKRPTQAASTTSSARSAGHRPTARKPATPRRASGPSGGVTRPRRTSGPARSAPRPARRGHTARTAPRGGLRTRAAAFIRGLPDHSLLDRIVRGRAWIPILGALLAGIVAMQVETLKLGASTGRALERGTALASLNEQLRASVAVLGDDQRIERLGAGMGMVMAGPTSVKFLYGHQRGNLSRALNGIQQPNATTFIASLPASVAAAGATTAATASTTAATASTTAVTAPTTPGTTTPATTGPVTPATVTGAATPASTGSTTPATTGTAAPTGTTATPTGTSGAAPPGAAAPPPTAPATTPSTTTPTGATAVTPGG
jgi:hypothetical protein